MAVVVATVRSQPALSVANSLAVTAALVLGLYGAWTRESENRREFRLLNEVTAAKARIEDLLHSMLPGEIVDRIQHHVVLEGMGLICLHSAHFSKIFKRLMGTTCNLRWREIGEHERIWVVEQGHPIAAGLPAYFEVPQTEMYGERFDIPAPDTLVFVSWFQGGEVFRSGCCYNRGRGKVFYFRPGHETFPIFYQPEIQKVLSNAVRWAAPNGGPAPTFGNVQPLENVQ